MQENEITVNRAEDGREFAEMLKALSDKEKAQVRGIIIGLVMARDARADNQMKTA